MNHYEDEKKNIGLIVEDEYADFNKEIVHSVAHAVIGRKDINLILLAGRHDESEEGNNGNMNVERAKVTEHDS